MGTAEAKAAILANKTALGIEFGSTRIKAVLVDDKNQPIASGGHEWENRYDYEICKQSLEYYNDTEIYRKEVHEQFPALYPDDIENISNMSEEQSYLCCQIQATLLQRTRSSKPIDTSCWCTCPKKESQN